MVKSCRAAVGIVHTDQITKFMIAEAAVTMLLTNGGYPFMKLLGVATADEVAAGSAGRRALALGPGLAVVAGDGGPLSLKDRRSRGWV